MHFPKPAALITGIVLAIVLLGGGLLFMNGALPGRAADEEPRDVVVSDITSNSVKISFATGSRAQGVVEYGLSPTTLNLLAPESESVTEHEVELTLLSEDTTYYFQISIGGKKYDNAGVPWTFSTASSEPGSANRTIPTLPSAVPSQARISPRVTQSVSSCTETNCEQIKLKLGKGCTTQDYVKCLRRGPTNKPLTTP